MLTKIKKIIVFGGGTSGWLTAAYLLRNLQIPAEIILIEDSTIGPIGVGEGTQPMTAQFLYRCGIPPGAWMKDSEASFKYGVELVGWNADPYFVDNDASINCIAAQDLYTSDYFIDKPYSEFGKWHPAYQLAKANVSPKYEHFLDTTFGAGEESYGAVHFSAANIIKTIKKLIIDKITYIDTKIVNVKQDMHGITKLINIDGNEFKADLYLDCTGFKSILLEQTLGVPFESYTPWLFNDKAVVIQTQFKDPVKECFPYTKATAMDAGWMFTIPIFTRTGNGYVYSSKFITPEDAELEFRKKINDYTSPAKHLDIKTGYHKEIAVKNVCAIGLSAGFVEPLEATGITFTTAIVKSVVDLLNMQGNVWNNTVKYNLNRGFYEMSMEILGFVWAHYHFSSKNNTPYWQAIRNQKLAELPDDVQKIIAAYYPEPNRFLYFSPSSMFNIVQWFSVLHAGGAYTGTTSKLTTKQKEYMEYYLKVQQYRVDTAKEMFPKQYDYLKEWYNK